MERLRSSPERVAIVLDPDTPISGPKIKPFAEASWLDSGGLLEAPSHQVPGLQLADFAAYTITRYRLKRADIAAGQASEFERIVALTLAQLEGRVTCLLNADHAPEVSSDNQNRQQI